MKMMKFWIEDQLLAGLNKAMFNPRPKTMSSMLFLLLSGLGGLYT
jgi:16S rRNA A1518/A1519 N6-dimethyltransferase RsmA/KsgA/DIM1 with predicted DNA glycosylase/AP lyase activity